MTSSSRNCCFMIPLNTGVYLITIFGLINKFSGFYGLISLDYSDPIVVCIHVYSLVALSAFAAGLYGIVRDKFNFVRWFTMFYWLDLLVGTAITIYLSIQWFLYTDHSLPELSNDAKQQHDDTFHAESIVSIVCLCLIRLTHLYFAYVLTSYYVSMGKAQYSKLTAKVDEELKFAGYDEMNQEDDDDDDTSPLTKSR